MKFYEVDLETMIPATQTVLVWAQDEHEAQEKALEGDILEDDGVEADFEAFEPEDVIDCREVAEEDVDERNVLMAQKEAKGLEAEEVVAD